MDEDKLVNDIARWLFDNCYGAQPDWKWDNTELDDEFRKLWREEAGRLLTELRTAGYAIVELPEPDYVDEADDDGHKGYGFNGGNFEGWYAHGGRVYAAEGDMSPRDARDLAAALLAAADAAERGQ